MLFNKMKVLVLAPHTDDGEIGCGGTINKLIQEGHEVHYIAFSSCAESLPPHLPSDILIREVKEATKRLGINENCLHIYDFPVRRFFEHRQDILEVLVRFSREMSPDLIFAPSVNDIHQDHHIIATEAIRAFKTRTILAYEMPWNNTIFETRSFIYLDENHIQAKIHALGAYESQKARPYMTPEFIKSLAHVRGSSVNTTYAEAFDIVRLVQK